MKAQQMFMIAFDRGDLPSQEQMLKCFVYVNHVKVDCTKSMAWSNLQLFTTHFLHEARDGSSSFIRKLWQKTILEERIDRLHHICLATKMLKKYKHNMVPYFRIVWTDFVKYIKMIQNHHRCFQFSFIHWVYGSVL